MCSALEGSWAVEKTILLTLQYVDSTSMAHDYQNVPYNSLSCTAVTTNNHVAPTPRAEESISLDHHQRTNMRNFDRALCMCKCLMVSDDVPVTIPNSIAS
jgi:hypothetical protein